MPALNISIDDVLTTTRAVRRRLDLDRPVAPETIRECLEIAIQAPTPGGQQNWRFIVVTDSVQRAALGDVYRRAAAASGQEEKLAEVIAQATDEASLAKAQRMADSARYLTRNMHRIPVLVVPCLEGRIEHLTPMEQAAQWGGIWPAAWSFMLAARSRGLGTVPTTIHLALEREAAEVLGIPYERVMQAGLIGVGHTAGTRFRPAPRKPVDAVTYWDRWPSQEW